MFVLEPEKLKIELILIDVVNLKVVFSQTLIFVYTKSNFTLSVGSLEKLVYKLIKN